MTIVMEIARLPLENAMTNIIPATTLPWMEQLGKHQGSFGERLKAAGLHFEGRPYPVSLRPLLLTRGQACKVATAAERLLPLLERVADIYCESPAARAFFPAYRTVEPLLTAPPAFRPLVQVARLDGVLSNEGDFQVFETGADGPGGVIQNGIAGRLWLETANDLGISKDLQLQPQPLVDEPGLLAKQLLAAHAAQFATAPTGAAVVNLRGRWTNEVDWIAADLRAAGVPSEVVDARDFRYKDGKVFTTNGLAVTLTYNKPEQNDLISEPAARRYIESSALGELAVINPPLAYLVLGDKAALAVLSDPQFASAFSFEEQDFIRTHVPWIRFLRESRTTDPEGRQISLGEYVLVNQRNLVFKPVNLTRGEDVLVGRFASAEQWRAAVTGSLSGRTNAVVQSYVPLPDIDVPTAGGTRERMVHGLDVYIFGGRAVGFQCRASLDPVVNIGRRGMLLPPVVVA